VVDADLRVALGGTPINTAVINSNTTFMLNLRRTRNLRGADYNISNDFQNLK